MKANELRVGDWVSSKDKYFKIAKIVTYLGNPQLYKQNFVGCWSGNVYCNKGFDKIEPIPLTPEILEKAKGFVRVDKHEFRYGNLVVQFALYENGYKAAVFFHGTLINYVEHLHNFQNLIHALGSEELNIDLTNHKKENND